MINLSDLSSIFRTHTPIDLQKKKIKSKFSFTDFQLFFLINLSKLTNFVIAKVD